MDVILAGECVMGLALPGIVYALLMRVPGIGRAVRRVQRWQRQMAVAAMCDGTEGGDKHAGPDAPVGRRR